MNEAGELEKTFVLLKRVTQHQPNEMIERLTHHHHKTKTDEKEYNSANGFIHHFGV